MKKIGRLVLVVLLAFAMFTTTPTMAKTKGVKVKVVGVKNSSKSVNVKMKITNNTKKSVEYGSYFDLYKKKSGKWRKVSWKGARIFDDESHVLLPGSTAKQKYILSKTIFIDSFKKGKYQIRFKVSGKVKKASFKL